MIQSGGWGPRRRLRVMVQITRRTKQEWRRQPRTYDDSLSTSTAPHRGPLNRGRTSRRRSCSRWGDARRSRNVSHVVACTIGRRRGVSFRRGRAHRLHRREPFRGLSQAHGHLFRPSTNCYTLSEGFFATVLAHRKEAPVAYTGQSLKRFEDPRLLTGQGAFLDDLTFPDMLYAVVPRSPHAHAAIRAIDTATARHAPGVVAVITAADLEGVVEPLPTRRETEAQELRPPVHPILARARCVTPGSPWPLSSPRSATWSAMPWPVVSQILLRRS